ncbi:MAG: glycosyltransferase family 2 protein [Ornithinimicrobium sp.]
MTTWVVLLLLVLGLNVLFWGVVGLMRLIEEHGESEQVGRHVVDADRLHGLNIGDVAVLMAAHNEELVIARSLRSLADLMPADQIHVVSDASDDRTVALARRAGVNVIETPHNVGKASALAYGIERFQLLARYEAVTLLDADTQLDPGYYAAALPRFADARVAAVAGCAHTRWERRLGFLGNIAVGYRQRVYLVAQLLVKYGQTWRGISATHIVPGFASTYRSSALARIQVDRPGLVIEDFNMTFEVQAKRLGRIVFQPQALAYTQDPATLRDYVRQTRRWSLGLWQTVRRYRGGRPVFTIALGLTLLELLTSTVVFLLLPIVVLAMLLGVLVPDLGAMPLVGAPLADIDAFIDPVDLLLGIMLPDYLLTCFAAFAERRPRYLFDGLFFLPMRVVDAVVTLVSIPRAWLVRSSGAWTSPTRRDMTDGEGQVVAPARDSRFSQAGAR